MLSAGHGDASLTSRRIDSSRTEEKAQPVDGPHRIGPGIAVGIHPAGDSDRVSLNIPSPPRHIVPEAVVVQPGVAIELLAREAQVLHNQAGNGAHLAERPVTRGPDYSLRGVGSHL